MSLQLRVTMAIETVTDFEEVFDRADIDGLEFLESDPADPSLNSSTAETIIVALASAGGVKAFKDLMVAYINSRKAKITVRNNKNGISVTFDGTIKSQMEVAKLVDRVTSSEPQE